MSIESVNEDLAKLEADVRNLAEDARKPAKDRHPKATEDGAATAGDQTQSASKAADPPPPPHEPLTPADEVVAAQFIATEETIDYAGTVLEALGSLGEIQRDQLRHFMEDQRELFTALTNVRSPFALIELGMDHWQRRSKHVAEGLNQAVDVITNESRHLGGAVTEMWKPFRQLIKEDREK